MGARVPQRFAVDKGQGEEMTVRGNDSAHRHVTTTPGTAGRPLSFTRRQLLTAVPGLMLVAAGVACGDDDEPTQSPAASPTTAAAAATATIAPTPASPTTAPAGPWTFTDDRGIVIERETMPTRVVAYAPIAASLWDFGIEVVGVFGSIRREDGTPEIHTGRMDLDAMVSLGETYGEINLEALAALQPELILSDMWPVLDVWGLTEDSVAQVEALAPIGGIKFADQSVTVTIARIAELAEALGADLSAPEVAAARERFDTASEAVRAAADDKPGLTVLIAAAWEENLYIANPPAWADLVYFSELGLDLVVPEIPADELWETLSWEMANKYPADLVLNDARSGSLTFDQLGAIPTWASHPAQQAGQIAEWHTEFVPSYEGFAGVLERLAETVESSDADIA